MHRCYLFILIVSFIASSCGSTNKQYGSRDAVLDSYLDRAKYFLNVNPDSALYYTLRSAEAAELIGSIEGQKASLLLNSKIFRQSGHLKRAFQAAQEARILIINDPSDSTDAEIFLQLGGLRTDLGQYDKALENYRVAEHVFESIPLLVKKGEAIANIALIYYRLGDLKNAEKYNLEAGKIWEKYPQALLGSASFHNLNGYIQIERLLYDSAAYSFAEARDIYEEKEDPIRFSNAHINLGLAELAAKNFGLALEYFEEAAKLSSILPYRQIHIDALNKMGIAYTKLGLLGKADSVLSLGLTEAQEVGDQALLAEFYLHLSELHREREDFEKAYGYHELLRMQRDKIFDVQRALSVSEFEVQYETEKIKATNESLTQQNRLRTILLIFSGVVLILVLVVGFLLMNRKNFKLKLLNQQRELDSERIRQQELANKKLEVETQLKNQENKLLQEEVQHKVNELSSLTMHQYQKNESLGKILGTLEEIESSLGDNSELSDLRSLIISHLNLDEDWERFKMHFDDVHKGFFDRVTESFPVLTNQDLRHCSYIRMNLSTKEISRLMNINPTSVQKARVRLKQKLDLAKDEDLYNFIQRF